MASADEMYDAAMTLKGQGDLAGAVAKLEEVLTVDPQHIHTHSALGVLCQKIGRLDDAVKHAMRVVELNPQDAFSYTQLSVICMRCGKIPEAEDAMARARLIQGQAGGHRHQH